MTRNLRTILAAAAIGLMAAPALADEYGDYLFVPFPAKGKQIWNRNAREM